MVELVLSALKAAIPAGTPLLYGTLGEVIAERSGVLNLGIEGMMIMGAVVGFGVASASGSLLAGVIAAALVGGALALLHAFASVSLRVNQVVSGLALTMFGLGLSGLIGKQYIGVVLTARFRPLELPLLSDLPVLGPLLFQFDPLVYLGVLLVPLIWVVLYKTSWGVTLRSVGESPAAADAAGVSVFRVRYAAVAFGGAMAGLGGAYLSLVYTPSWIEGMTAGAGWIVIGLTIVSIWDPFRALPAAYLFGGVRVLQFRLQPLGISPNLLNTLPYLVTIIVLFAGTARRRVFAPAALGLPYSREER